MDWTKADVSFRPKSSYQKEDCINRSAEHDCPNPSTLEAVVGTASVRSCTEEKCKDRASELALMWANAPQSAGETM
jgi:hypothetical protein